MDIDLETILVAGKKPSRLENSTPWIGHIPFAFFITKVIKPKIIVELGTHMGNSFCSFVQAVDELSLNTKCFAIDTWVGDPHAGYYGESVYLDLHNYIKANYGDNVKMIRKTFDEAVVNFENDTIDILHIDGLHTYEAVKHDFETWKNKISENGIVLFHDINVFADGFGVHRFWNEIKTDYPNIEFKHSNGLGILAYGKKAKIELIQFFEKFNSDPDYVRLFEMFGENVNNLHSLKFLNVKFQSEVDNIKSSWRYRIGSYVLTPFSFIKKIIKNF